VITPFHFACFCEERLRAQADILDPALGGFMRIHRRFSLADERAVLQFCVKAAPESSPIASMVVELVQQKSAQTAFNCLLDNPETKEQKNFRLLLVSPEEAEPQILKILTFVQRAFQPHKYKEAGQSAPDTSVAETEKSALETAQNLVSSAGKAVTAVAAAPAKAATATETLSPEAAAITHGKKYIVAEGPTDDGTVHMRTYDGKYVPEGELPATIKVHKQ
jgi:hypothetical protein